MLFRYSGWRWAYSENILMFQNAHCYYETIIFIFFKFHSFSFEQYKLGKFSINLIWQNFLSSPNQTDIGQLQF
jgi:hypothetical protein